MTDASKQQLSYIPLNVKRDDMRGYTDDPFYDNDDSSSHLGYIVIYDDALFSTNDDLWSQFGYI